ncbi:hypothetical protein [Paenibacillus hubeiensis]|uniref:hypothetical protein n=1 Tax=Paenibacillus hubeiensis TaxID=3077330 RepID=UPI0031BA5FC6
MLALFTFCLGAFAFFKIGRKYQDFQDLMLARRVARLVDQREKFQREQAEYEKYERQDERIRKVNEKIGEEMS